MRLRDIREDRDLTQAQIAEVLQVKQNTYQQYESETRQIPIQALMKLCLYYRLSADYILELPEGLPYPKR